MESTLSEIRKTCSSRHRSKQGSEHASLVLLLLCMKIDSLSRRPGLANADFNVDLTA